MAFIHHTTLTPTKPELLAAWLPGQPWYRDGGRPPELTRVGGFRLDDPDGQVGLEFMVVTDAVTGATYLTPLTYRDRELPGADDALIGTAEHGVLGRRWIYDGAYDPALAAQLVALIQGAAQPQDQNESNTPDPTVTTGPSAAGPVLAGTVLAETRLAETRLAETGPPVVSSTAVATELQLAGGLTVWINRVLQPGTEEAGPSVSATWQLPDGTVARGVFATAQPAQSAQSG